MFSRLFSERIVFLGGEVDDDVANVVMAQFIHLEAASTSQEISLEMVRHRLPVVMVVARHSAGHAGSGRAVVAAPAGRHGARRPLGDDVRGGVDGDHGAAAGG
ncbi:ATP-dependent Clp protease proteolytic subunit [Actinopolymorpha pittospori]|uniref:Uncharacterized protein n=1 Tax=Actinopolymorpha pittospori TaxID=648752 RepID=A0A927MRY2_9ACTN|nr:hypothetical protein [Actinopolymorpha pittospori]